VQTIGTTSNRDGIGARVELTMSGGATAWQIVKTGSSYASQSELPLTFGLGATPDVSAISVKWPSGRVDKTGTVKANQVITIKEGAGIVSAVPIKHSGTK
jgi:enediyne biosynthesis protein E4